MLIQYKKAGIPPALRTPHAVRNAVKAAALPTIQSSFRIITVTDGLQQIDQMICDGIRTAVTGKTGKSKYRLSYKTIQTWGYRSLVSQYYRHLKDQK